MQQEKFANIASELDEIFKYLDKDILVKIPEELKEQISKNKNPNHKCNIDKNKEFEEQDLMEETKQILAVIYLDYCCTDAEREEILLIQENNVNKINEEKIGVDKLQKIFNENMQSNTLEDDNLKMISIKEMPWYKRIINRIKMIFK